MSKLSSPLAVNHFYYEGHLQDALKSLGKYVYGYYSPSEATPFYVGKGENSRVLDHWRNAIKGKTEHDQYKIILGILKSGQLPKIKILAYNLKHSKSKDSYGIVERVLQNAFGIQRVWEKRPGYNRLIRQFVSTLVQKREDSSKHPVLSLEAAYCKGNVSKWIVNPKNLAETYGSPILLVGLMKTYHPIYSQNELGEMARMWWNLDLFANTTFPILRKDHSAILLGWASKLGGKPQIVGAWRISGKWKKDPKYGRWSCEISNDISLRRELLGSTLSGTGNYYQGPRIYIPG